MIDWLADQPWLIKRLFFGGTEVMLAIVALGLVWLFRLQIGAVLAGATAIILGSWYWRWFLMDGLLRRYGDVPEDVAETLPYTSFVEMTGAAALPLAAYIGAVWYLRRRRGAL